MWGVLCLNVSAGIGVIGIASPMLQEIFGGELLGVAKKFGELSEEEKGRIAAIAAGFTGLLSLFNIGGRFFWASLSDRLGRKLTYAVFFVLGFAMYVSLPWSGSAGSIALFVAAACIIVSMYGGGFATVPAYLADLFGTQMVGAIHGRLLTAWATAGILGPVVVNYMRDYQLGLGIPREQVYNQTMYILAGMLLLGLACNLALRPVASKWLMSEEEVASARQLAHARATSRGDESITVAGNARAAASGRLVIAWLVVGLPLAWGVWVTLQKALILFS